MLHLNSDRSLQSRFAYHSVNAKAVLRANVQRSSYMSFAFNSIIEGHIQVNACLAYFITNTLTNVSSMTNSLTCSLHVSFIAMLEQFGTRSLYYSE